MDSKWQPIETAPKNGKPILIFEKPYLWMCDNAEPTIYVVSWDVWKEAWIEHLGEQYAMFEPTYWMPLPEPPTKGENE